VGAISLVGATQGAHGLSGGEPRGLLAGKRSVKGAHLLICTRHSMDLLEETATLAAKCLLANGGKYFL
jgi:hypothetical protein